MGLMTGDEVPFLTAIQNFALHCLQTDSGTQRAYLMHTGGFSVRGKADRV
jgi:hypothetical protein